MDEESQSIIRLKRGELQGLEALVRRYYPRAAGAAFLVLHDAAQAEDVAQEAFLHLLDTIHQFDASRPFAPWFLRSVVNAALNRARQNRRSTPLELDLRLDPEMELERLIDPQPGPEEVVETVEVRRQVWQALERLAPEQRAVIVMRYYLDMDESEMSTEMGSPPSTIKWWLRSARLRLRRLLNAFHSTHVSPHSQPQPVPGTPMENRSQEPGYENDQV